MIVSLFFAGLVAISSPESEFYKLKATSIEGKEVDFSEFKDKVVMIVNVASRCGFTPQYDALRDTYDKYAAKGFTILGFPSNQFLGQEPGSNAEIKKFCEDNYRVKFPLFQKADVNGENRQGVYQYLLKNAPEGMGADIGWNFTKFLISRDGQVVDRFGSMTKPSDPKVIAAIEKQLSVSPKTNLKK